MKKIILSLFILFSFQVLLAQPPKGKAKPGSGFGKKIDALNSISASELPILLKSKDTLTVKIKAKTLDACAAKGCWMTLQVNDSTTAFVKMKDYNFFVPLDIIGKTVVLEGISFIKTTNVSELKHYAEDAKKNQSEIDAITQPKNEIRFVANGILVIE